MFAHSLQCTNNDYIYMKAITDKHSPSCM